MRKNKQHNQKNVVLKQVCEFTHLFVCKLELDERKEERKEYLKEAGNTKLNTKLGLDPHPMGTVSLQLVEKSVSLVLPKYTPIQNSIALKLSFALLVFIMYSLPCCCLQIQMDGLWEMCIYYCAVFTTSSKLINYLEQQISGINNYQQTFCSRTLRKVGTKLVLIQGGGFFFLNFSTVQRCRWENVPHSATNGNIFIRDFPSHFTECFTDYLVSFLKKCHYFKVDYLGDQHCLWCPWIKKKKKNLLPSL